MTRMFSCCLELHQGQPRKCLCYPGGAKVPALTSRRLAVSCITQQSIGGEESGKSRAGKEPSRSLKSWRSLEDHKGQVALRHLWHSCWVPNFTSTYWGLTPVLWFSMLFGPLKQKKVLVGALFVIVKLHEGSFPAQVESVGREKRFLQL